MSNLGKRHDGGQTQLRLLDNVFRVLTSEATSDVGFEPSRVLFIHWPERSGISAEILALVGQRRRLHVKSATQIIPHKMTRLGDS